MKTIFKFVFGWAVALASGFVLQVEACTFGHVGLSTTDLYYHESQGVIPVYLTFADSGSCNGGVTITVQSSSTAQRTNDYTSPPITFGFPCSSLGCVTY